MSRHRRRREIAYRRVASGEQIHYRKSRRHRTSIPGLGVVAVFLGLVVLMVVCVCIDRSGKRTTESDSLLASSEMLGSVVVSGTVDPKNAEVGGAGGQETGEGQSTMGDQETDEDQSIADQDSWNYRSDDRPKVKGIYVTGPMAGNAAFDNLLSLVDETELNAMVIDIKNDAGEITYKMNLETAQAMNACINYISDIEGLMKRLKEHNVYTIARIVCFKDPYLAVNYPNLALKKPDGTAIVDGHGIAWVNPYKEQVWRYLVDVAKEAAKLGFDEVQFDYVRFPIGTDADAADYGVDMTIYTKQQAITDFLQYAKEELHKEGIPVTADVFGTIIGNETDVKQVGQDYRVLAETIDAICPMVYPSHYGNGVFGLAVPDAKPYETVLAAMQDSAQELADIPVNEQAVVRPWLQAFTASWVEGYISYGGEQIRAQIQAVYDAGYEEWILWNASNKYSADGLKSQE